MSADTSNPQNPLDNPSFSDLVVRATSHHTIAANGESESARAPSSASAVDSTCRSDAIPAAIIHDPSSQNINASASGARDDSSSVHGAERSFTDVVVDPDDPEANEAHGVAIERRESFCGVNAAAEDVSASSFARAKVPNVLTDHVAAAAEPIQRSDLSTVISPTASVLHHIGSRSPMHTAPIARESAAIPIVLSSRTATEATDVTTKLEGGSQAPPTFVSDAGHRSYPQTGPRSIFTDNTGAHGEHTRPFQVYILM